MPGGMFSKQADWFSQRLNSANANDTVIGGALSVAPSGLNASQGFQTLPGDRVILSPIDALALSNNAVGNLYTGTYRYVLTYNSTSTPTRGHGAFWIPAAANNNITAQDALYQTTSDEQANYGVSLFAGVYVNSPGKNNYWWIQESGKATCAFVNAITGTPAIGKGVYLAGAFTAANNNNAIDVGAFNQLFGANQGVIFAANGTAGYNAIDGMLVGYVGPAESLPANNNTAIVDITLGRASFRF